MVHIENRVSLPILFKCLSWENVYLKVVNTYCQSMIQMCASGTFGSPSLETGHVIL